MEQSLLLSLIAFAWITCVTPGPNNVMLTSSGARFGFWQSIQHIAGISGGLVCMLTLMALGVGAVFQQWPVLQWMLKIGGSAICFIWPGKLRKPVCQSWIRPSKHRPSSRGVFIRRCCFSL